MAEGIHPFYQVDQALSPFFDGQKKDRPLKPVPEVHKLLVETSEQEDCWAESGTPVPHSSSWQDVDVQDPAMVGGTWQGPAPSL